MVPAPQIPVEPTQIVGTLGNDSCAPVIKTNLMEILILAVLIVCMIPIAIQSKSVKVNRFAVIELAVTFSRFANSHTILNEPVPF